MDVSTGKYGVWRRADGLDPALATEIERLGYGTIWIGGSPPADLDGAEQLLAATERITVATGIVNMWTSPADEVAASYHRIAARFPGRFLLGVGIGHPEAITTYTSPFDTIVRYLDGLDAADVPVAGRVLAALGPKVLKVAAERTAGAHPYLTTPEHTRRAREIMGDGVLLAPELKVFLGTDREPGRRTVATPYLRLGNYTRNLRKFGFTEEDVTPPGSDRLIDALVARGSAADIAARLDEHLAAGASHVAAHVIDPPDGSGPLPTLRELAQALQLR